MSLPLDTCLHGDALTVLRTLPDECVQTCVTSPPYWGLRDYGTATWEGGAEDCEHRPPDEAGVTRKPSEGQREHAGRFSGPTCWSCGARRIDAQLGLEPTPEEYVARMVEVFREVRRVLRDDGTLWLNLGDSYNVAKGNPGPNSADPKQAARRGWVRPQDWGIDGLKPKDLVGIPWRVAFALQADGWYLRQDIIWAKPNPMPESVTDRCTKAHEYLFLLSKSPRYFYDAEAIREDGEGYGRSNWNAQQFKGGDITRNHGGKGAHGRGGGTSTCEGNRNRRSVWTVPSAPYPEAHFATFPRALIEPCILAGAPTGGVVLDPFLGSGTTAQVAQDLGRRWLGIELNAEYIALQAARTAQTAMVL